jgi:hypothetical protein
MKRDITLGNEDHMSLPIDSEENQLEKRAVDSSLALFSLLVP